jgi:hypothetical protein
MQIDFIKDRIKDFANEVDVIVLKGFMVKDIIGISQQYLWLDKYVVAEGRIDLQQVNAQRLMIDLFHPLENTSILTYESFLELTSTVRNLSILQKKICILGSPAKTCVYPKIIDRRYRKKFTSMTPLN